MITLLEPNKGQFVERRSFEHEPLRREDMSVVGSCFGLRFTTGGTPNGLIELYVEDDELYHYATSFNHFWLRDLKNLIEQALVEDWKSVSADKEKNIDKEDWLCSQCGEWRSDHKKNGSKCFDT